ncbi:hypothetical protein [Phocaeicola barnesiae]|uniref:hypothetical protein n=1 Tax=Phocaeicola barnesiae TaxID=376804 RepID=UPI00241C6BB9|nr:hypothetical protein [Phocaeicola barnesiae]
MYKARQNKETISRVIENAQKKVVQKKDILSNGLNINSTVIQRQISQDAYNTARNILINAGSETARASHPLHNGSVPDYYGLQLLQEARDAFRQMDVGENNLRSGMTQAHYRAIHDAADEMGIQQW